MPLSMMTPELMTSRLRQLQEDAGTVVRLAQLREGLGRSTSYLVAAMGGCTETDVRAIEQASDVAAAGLDRALRYVRSLGMQAEPDGSGIRARCGDLTFTVR